MRSKKAELREQNGGCQGRGLGKWEVLAKEHNVPSVKKVRAGDLMHSRVTIINSTELYLKFVTGVNLKCYHHTDTQNIKIM